MPIKPRRNQSAQPSTDNSVVGKHPPVLALSMRDHLRDSVSPGPPDPVISQNDQTTAFHWRDSSTLAEPSKPFHCLPTFYFAASRVETSFVRGILFAFGHLFKGKIAKHQSKSRALSNKLFR